MSKKAKLEDNLQQEQVLNSQKRPGTGLLETFNEALSSIISHRKKSVSPTTQTPEPVNMEKTSKPVIWFPDEAVRSSPNLNTGQQNFARKNVCEMEPAFHQEATFDKYDEWVDGSKKYRYQLSLREAQSHSSGWAMKYTNNHNKFVLKKTCVGVLTCSDDCTMKNGNKILIRPAISDKVRERQLDQPCPNPECRNGRILHKKCSGNNGYPVTHFWVHQMDCIQFEAKGSHDHPKPEAKRTTIRKKEDHIKYSSTFMDSLFNAPNHYAENQDFHTFPQKYPQSAETIQTFLNIHSHCIQSFDITDGNEHVCFMSPRMRDIAQQIIWDQEHMMSLSKPYVLCRTLRNYVRGFHLLESRIISSDVPECPLLLVTLYRADTVDGVIEHVRHLAAMCSPRDQKIRVPKWHFLIHDFQQDLLSLVVETIVNLMVDSQMQTLLNEFQYKSVSSLYKMLRQRMFSTMRTFHEHFVVCKYELLLRMQDSVEVTSSEELFSRLQSHTAKEFVHADHLIKDGVFGSQVQDFWRFWGNELISSAVFPAASTVYAPLLHRHTAHCSTSDFRCRGGSHLQEAFLALIQWLEQRSVLYSQIHVHCHSYHKLQPKRDWAFSHFPQCSSGLETHGISLACTTGHLHYQ